MSKPVFEVSEGSAGGGGEGLAGVAEVVEAELVHADLGAGWGVLPILDRASPLRGCVHARAAPEVQPAVQG
jgi:hypothetical protein